MRRARHRARDRRQTADTADRQDACWFHLASSRSRRARSTARPCLARASVALRLGHVLLARLAGEAAGADSPSSGRDGGLSRLLRARPPRGGCGHVDLPSSALAVCANLRGAGVDAPNSIVHATVLLTVRSASPVGAGRGLAGSGLRCRPTGTRGSTRATRSARVTAPSSTRSSRSARHSARGRR